MDFTELQKRVALTARQHGFWDVDPLNNPASVDRKLMLVVGEIAEAHEEWRTKGFDPYYEHGDKPCGFLSELADAVIRLMDLAEQLGLDLESAIHQKEAYNRTRPHLHGKRF